MPASREQAATGQALAQTTHQDLRAGFAEGDDQFALLDGSPTHEWLVFREVRPHALLIGSEASTAAALARMSQYLRAPLAHWHPAAVLEPPPATGTLVVWEVDTVTRIQQALLLMWMDSYAADVQVISVARRPVFPLVLQQEFLDTLYYRLNTVCLALPDSLNVALEASSRLPHTVPMERGSGSRGAAVRSS